MKPVLMLIALLFGCCAQSTFAQGIDALRCSDEQLAPLARHLKIADLADKVVSTSCKAWPHVKGISLAAVAYDAGISDQKALVVAAIDNRTKAVLGTHEDQLTDDGVFQVNEFSLRLDTAAYRLDERTMAFGLRFDAGIRVSAPDGLQNDELTLFVLEPNKLRPVLKLPMLQMRALRGCINVQCKDSIWEEAVLTIRIGPPGKNGFADLLVAAKITTVFNDAPGGDESKPRIEREVLRYDGARYTGSRWLAW